jgi:hypothetical protein
MTQVQWLSWARKYADEHCESTDGETMAAILAQKCTEMDTMLKHVRKNVDDMAGADAWFVKPESVVKNIDQFLLDLTKEYGNVT